MRDKIMLEISNFCESCPSSGCCHEEECVLYRIEKLVDDRPVNTKIYEEIKAKYKDVSFIELHMIDTVKRDIEGSDLDFNEVYKLCHEVWATDLDGISINLIVDYITEYYDEVKDMEILDILQLICK